MLLHNQTYIYISIAAFFTLCNIKHITHVVNEGTMKQIQTETKH